MKQEQKATLENTVSPLQKLQQVFYWGANPKGVSTGVLILRVTVSFSFLVGQWDFPMSMDR